MKNKGWSKDELIEAVKTSFSVRQVLKKIGLVEAGGNYAQVKKYFKIYSIDTSHFMGKLWSKGRRLPFKPRLDLKLILTKDSNFQSYKLKSRLLREGLKQEQCEICGWSKRSLDGRIPLELDHIDGDHSNNILDNLRILCPNCHSLQLTHRGSNRRNTGRVVEWHTRGT